MLTAALTGFFTSLSLILAIGAQNAFVLRQGLMREHVFAVCLFCAVSDAVLITAGVLGFGALTERAPWLPEFMSIGGALFLSVYGAMRFRAAWRGDGQLATEVHGSKAGTGAPGDGRGDREEVGLRVRKIAFGAALRRRLILWALSPLGRTIAVAAALTWLNPHVYLDTLSLIGAVSTGFEPPAEKTAFGIAAATASFVFFFSLGHGARHLAPVMRRPRAWRILDALIGVTMWAIAAGLILSTL